MNIFTEFQGVLVKTLRWSGRNSDQGFAELFVGGEHILDILHAFSSRETGVLLKQFF